MLVVPLYILVMRHWLLSQDLSLREMYVELLATISIIGSIIGQEVVMLLPVMMVRTHSKVLAVVAMMVLTVITQLVSVILAIVGNFNKRVCARAISAQTGTVTPRSPTIPILAVAKGKNAVFAKAIFFNQIFAKETNVRALIGSPPFEKFLNYPGCNVDYPRNIGNGYCNGGDHNTAECGSDGGDCDDFNAKDPNCKVVYPGGLNPGWIGNGQCDGRDYSQYC